MPRLPHAAAVLLVASAGRHYIPDSTQMLHQQTVFLCTNCCTSSPWIRANYPARDMQGRQANRGERDVIRAAILDEAQIVFSTLSFAGSSVLTGATSKFDCVIIDEAAQAVEPSTLIPLVNGCEQVKLP